MLRCELASNGVDVVFDLFITTFICVYTIFEHWKLIWSPQTFHNVVEAAWDMDMEVHGTICWY